MKEKWLSNLVTPNLTIEMLAAQILPKSNIGDATNKLPITDMLVQHAEQAFKNNK